MNSIVPQEISGWNELKGLIETTGVRENSVCDLAIARLWYNYYTAYLRLPANDDMSAYYLNEAKIRYAIAKHQVEFMMEI